MPRGQRNIVSLARTMAGLSESDARVVNTFAKELRNTRDGKVTGTKRASKAAKRKAGGKKGAKKKAEPEADAGDDE